MARRATFQNALRQSATKDSPVLILTGGYEFAQFQAQKHPSSKRLEFLAKAFDLLRDDLVFVTPYERDILAKAGVRAHKSWLGSTRLEQRILGPVGHRVGVLVLPPLPDGAKAAPPAEVRLVEDAVRALRAKVQLVVAMSPWGYNAEQELLNATGPLPDLLLGSGPGIGLVGTITPAGKTLWVRAFTQGKSVSRIEILAWPDHASPTFKWTEGQNIRMTLYGLTDTYQDDQHMLSLMQSMGTD